MNIVHLQRKSFYLYKHEYYASSNHMFMFTQNQTHPVAVNLNIMCHSVKKSMSKSSSFYGHRYWAAHQIAWMVCLANILYNFHQWLCPKVVINTTFGQSQMCNKDIEYKDTQKKMANKFLHRGLIFLLCGLIYKILLNCFIEMNNKVLAAIKKGDLIWNGKQITWCLNCLTNAYGVSLKGNLFREVKCLLTLWNRRNIFHYSCLPLTCNLSTLNQNFHLLE